MINMELICTYTFVLMYTYIYIYIYIYVNVLDKCIIRKSKLNINDLAESDVILVYI